MADNRIAEREDRGENRPPEISVIIPAYRCKATLSKAVDSALLQEVPLEILVIDDASPEDLTEVMEKYAGEARVRFLKNPSNIGAAATRNRGVKMAAGEYVAFLDADDWWVPGKLKAQLACMKEKQVVLCCTARELVTPEGELTGRVIAVKEDITYKSLLLHNCINCSSVLVRKDVMEAFPMEHEDSHEDYITWLAILKKYRKAAALSEPYLKYRLTSTGKSGSKWKSAAKTYKVYRYSGFGRIRSCLLFCAYAVNGVRKYGKAYLHGKKERSQ